MFSTRFFSKFFENDLVSFLWFFPYSALFRLDAFATIAGGAAIVVPAPKGKGKKRGADAESKAAALLLKDFGIEYAVSGRAGCAGCHQKIAKDEVRIKKVAHDTEVGMKYGGQAVWHHVECFAQLRSELGWFESAEKLPGYKQLKADDKQTVKKHIP